MKTRRSLSNLEAVAKTDNSDTPSKRRSLSRVCRTPTSSKKEVKPVTTPSESRVNLNSDGKAESSLPPNVYNSPIVRVLRSRVVTSDTEDEVKSSRTPKRRLSRGSLKEDKPIHTENDKTPAKAEANKSPESGKKRSSRPSLFSIIEMEENEDTAKTAVSIKDKKAVKDLDSFDVNEECISRDGFIEGDSSETENVIKSKSGSKEAVRTPVSASKRSSLTSGNKETPSKGKKEKTPKSSGKRFSIESSFRLVGEGENERISKVNTIESEGSVKDDEIKHISAPAESAGGFDSENSSVITSDNIERDEGSSDTGEECRTKDATTAEESLETEYVNTKSKSANKERTPASAKKRSSIISNETPSRVEGKKEKTPKSSKKRFSLKGSFQDDEMDRIKDRVDATESVTSYKDGKVENTSSPMKKFGSKEASVLSSDNIEGDEGSSDTNEESSTKERVMEDESSETENVDTKFKSVNKERTPASAKKRSSFIMESNETPTRVEGKKEKTPKSSKKRFSLKGSFQDDEMDRIKDRVDATESVTSYKDGKVENTSSPMKKFGSKEASVLSSDNIEGDEGSSDTNEESSTKERVMEDESSETENVDTKFKSVNKERTPASAKKRSSFIMESNETPTRVEGKKEKTPKSSKKRFSLKGSFQDDEMDGIKDRVDGTESKDGKFENTSSPMKKLDSKQASVISSEGDEGSSDTNEESVTKERVMEDESSEAENVDTKSKSVTKEKERTPASAKKRSSFIMESNETPSRLEGMKEKTPKSSTKRSSLKGSFQDEENKEKTPKSSKKRSSLKGSFQDEEMDGFNMTESVMENKDEMVENASSPMKELDSEQSSVITSDKIEGDEDSSDTNEEEIATKDKIMEDEPLETKIVDTNSKSVIKEKKRTPASARRRSSLVAEKYETPSKVEGKKKIKTPKSSEKRFSIQDSFQVVELIGDEDSSDSQRGQQEPSTCVSESEEADSVSGSKEKERTPASARKRSSLVAEKYETPSKVEGKKKIKTPKSSEKRFSIQDSFQVVELIGDEDSSDSQRGQQEPSTCVSESEEADSVSGSKDSEEIESEEIDEDIEKENTSESLVRKAMLMTSLAIQGEKKKRMKTPQKSEKMFVEAAPEDESSEDSEDIQTEEISEQTNVVEENDSDSGSDSDDDVPESISFNSGKEQMNNAVKMAVEAIRREKERIKEQRRKRMEMIKTQKKEKAQRQMEKLKMLEKKLPKRLSEDVVNRLPDAPEIPTIKDVAAKKKKKKNKGETKDVEKVKSKKNKIMKFDDYIPLDDVKAATKFGIVPLSVMEKIPKSASEKAAEFKRQALFGSRIRREPSKNLLSYKQKIGAAFKSKEVNQQQRFKPY